MKSQRHIIYNKMNNKIPKTNLKKIYQKLNISYKEFLNLDLCIYSDNGTPVITPPLIYSYM